MFEPDEKWNKATPQDIPSPTYWPAVLALGLTFIFWGFVTTYYISIAGSILFVTGLGGWIEKLWNKRNTNNKKSSNES